MSSSFLRKTKAMTREDAKRWVNTDVFKHWLEGGQVEMVVDDNDNITLESPFWSEDLNYVIKSKDDNRADTK